MTTQTKQLEIILGPGRWDMMLAVFNGQTVSFQWGENEEAKLRLRDLCGFDNIKIAIRGITFLRHIRDTCTFTAVLPGWTGQKITVQGIYDLETRKGSITFPET